MLMLFVRVSSGSYKIIVFLLLLQIHLVSFSYENDINISLTKMIDTGYTNIITGKELLSSFEVEHFFEVKDKPQYKIFCAYLKPNNVYCEISNVNNKILLITINGKAIFFEKGTDKYIYLKNQILPEIILKSIFRGIDKQKSIENTFFFMFHTQNQNNSITSLINIDFTGIIQKMIALNQKSNLNYIFEKENLIINSSSNHKLTRFTFNPKLNIPILLEAIDEKTNKVFVYYKIINLNVSLSKDYFSNEYFDNLIKKFNVDPRPIDYTLPEFADILSTITNKQLPKGMFVSKYNVDKNYILQEIGKLSEKMKNTPNNPIDLMSLGKLYLEIEKFDESIFYIKDALTLFQNDDTFHIYNSYMILGDAYLKTQRFSLALKEFENAYKLNPKDTSSLFYMVIAYMNFNNEPSTKKAIEILSELKKNPNLNSEQNDLILKLENDLKENNKK
ncbi:MAG: hypothetical protein ACD_4C00020G0001 [uncultured bacterium (gcode 4)]|uniref:Uncharacterized protein n=1 Tax=uncultured bacterium (gcode 4) TaxID=1234023 RepID=K2GV44_9BACT|nr:MAG: hypothetical protein ACD_4C00020G0001 [uncultured bacterium (gcode 4)]